MTTQNMFNTEPKIPQQVTGSLRLTKGGGGSMHEFHFYFGRHTFSLSSPSYDLYLGSLKIARLKTLDDGRWVTDITEGNIYKTPEHAIKGIIRRIEGKVGMSWAEPPVEGWFLPRS